MAIANTFVSVLLASFLLSQAGGEGHGSCKRVLDKSHVVVRKDSGVTCWGLKWHVKCSGLCNSRSTVEVKDGAVHWKQECECCQPPIHGYQAKKVKLSMNCADGSTEYLETSLIIPERCQCTNC